MRKCYELMTEKPTTCLPTETVQQAARKMRDADAGPIPVVRSREDATVVGIVTDRDLALRVVAEGRDPVTTPVAEVMTSEVTTVNHDDDIDEAILRMESHRVRRIPVVGENGSIVGIISQADIATRIGQDPLTGHVVEKISR